MYNLFLDDIRDPDWVIGYNKLDWVIVRNHNDFIDYIKNNGLPTLTSLDHDLGDEHYEIGFKKYDLSIYDNFKEKTGYDSLKWLCNYCLESNKKLPIIKFHTANFIGLNNMKKYLKNFLKHYPELSTDF